MALIHMNGRLYDPRLGRFLAPDNYVQDPFGTQNFNRYGYALNNPLVYVDPNGEFLFIPVLVGIGVGILANGISNVIQDRPFFKGWIQAGVMGAIGGYIAGATAVGTTISSTATKGFVTTYSLTLPATAGQQALAAAIGVASSYIPGVNIPLGDNFAIGLSPALFMGAGGFGVGANVSASANIGDFTFGVSGGANWGKSNFTGNKGISSSFSGILGYNDGTHNISLSSTVFNSPGIRSQRVGTLSYQHKSGWGGGYSNDGVPFGKLGIGDNGDGFRSAAAFASYKDYSIGTQIFTGDRDFADDDSEPRFGYPHGTVRTWGAHDYMSGIAYVGFRGYRAGINDYRIGYSVQNWFAHHIMKPQAYFGWRDHPNRPINRFYGGYFRPNPFNLW